MDVEKKACTKSTDHSLAWLFCCVSRPDRRKTVRCPSLLVICILLSFVDGDLYDAHSPDEHTKTCWMGSRAGKSGRTRTCFVKSWSGVIRLLLVDDSSCGRAALRYGPGSGRPRMRGGVLASWPRR